MSIRYWRKFIERLEDMTNVQAIELCDSLGLRRLSNDSFTRQSRSVYALNDHYVLKIARNKVGAEQNQHEIDVYNLAEIKNRKYFAKLVLDVSSYRFVVMEKVTTFKEDGRGLFSISKTSSFEFHRNHAERIVSNYFYDLYKTANVGKRRGQVVALDYGFSKQAADMYRASRAGTRWQNSIELEKNFKLQIV